MAVELPELSFSSRKLSSWRHSWCFRVPLRWVASIIGRCEWENAPTFKPPLTPPSASLGFGLMQSYKDVESKWRIGGVHHYDAAHWDDSGTVCDSKSLILMHHFLFPARWWLRERMAGNTTVSAGASLSAELKHWNKTTEEKLPLHSSRLPSQFITAAVPHPSSFCPLFHMQTWIPGSVRCRKWYLLVKWKVRVVTKIVAKGSRWC